MPDLIAALLKTMAPIVLEIVEDHQAHNGALPTTDEITATFYANVDKYLGEGSAWRAANPR